MEEGTTCLGAAQPGGCFRPIGLNGDMEMKIQRCNLDVTFVYVNYMYEVKLNLFKSSDFLKKSIVAA